MPSDRESAEFATAQATTGTVFQHLTASAQLDRVEHQVATDHRQLIASKSCEPWRVVRSMACGWCLVASVVVERASDAPCGSNLKDGALTGECRTPDALADWMIAAGSGRRRSQKPT
jgi:hypothetical protein